MNIQIAIDVALGVSIAAFVIVALFSLSRISYARFVASLSFLAVFFLTLWVRGFLDGGTPKLSPLLLFVWLWCFAFYFLGLRFASGRGVLSKMPFSESNAISSQGDVSPRLARVLQWWRHLLIWPMVAVVAIVVVRGIAGFGWTTTLTW